MGFFRLESCWCDASVLRSSQTGRPLMLEYQKSGPPCLTAAPMPLIARKGYLKTAGCTSVAFSG